MPELPVDLPPVAVKPPASLTGRIAFPLALTVIGAILLGLVSYHNPNFVLDLGGLASQQARILRMSAASAEEYRAFVAGSGVHLVIIYDEWFPKQIPASWIKVASMDLSRERVSSAEAEVQFYATDAATASQLKPELQSFSKSLPPGVKLKIYSLQMPSP
jgi:hypothetical protein